MGKRSGQRVKKRIGIPAGIGLSAGSILFTLILLEAFTRVFYYTPRGRSEVPGTFRISSIPGVNYELTPDHDFIWHYDAPYLFGKGFNIPVHINSLGFRDDDISVQKPGDTLRILVLGDSYSMAMGVPVEEGYVERLEEALNDRTGGHPTVEVINTAVGGYSIHQEAAFLKGRGWLLQPDMILIGFHTNDIRSAGPCHITPDGFIEQDIPDETKRRLHYRGIVYNAAEKTGFIESVLLHSHFVRWLAGRNPRRTDQMVKFYGAGKDKSIAEKAFMDIVNSARSQNVPVFVIIFTDMDIPVSDNETAKRMKWIESMCRSTGIPYVSMWEALKGYDPEKLIVHPKDRHPNSRAHALFAELLLKYISVKNGTLTIRNPHPFQPPADPLPITRSHQESDS